MKNYLSLVIVCACVYTIGYGVPLSVFALSNFEAISGVTCSGVNADSSLPAGFGSPAGLFHRLEAAAGCPPSMECPAQTRSSQYRNTIEAECHADDFEVRAGPTEAMAISSDSNGMMVMLEKTKIPFYVWKYGYRWDGTAWKQFEYTPGQGAVKTEQGWILGGAEKTNLPYINEESYVLAYTCTNTGTPTGPVWKCGCRDEKCTTSHWQLQAAVKTNNVTPALPDNPKSDYMLTVSKVGGGASGGYVQSDDLIGQTNAVPPSSRYGIMCGSDCSEAYTIGKKVVLRASPARSDTVFSGWGGVCSSSGSSPTCTVTMDAIKNVTAEFSKKGFLGEKKNTLTVLKFGNGASGGYVQSDDVIGQTNFTLPSIQ